MHTKKRTTTVDNVGEGPLRDVDVFAMNKVTNRKGGSSVSVGYGEKWILETQMVFIF